MTTVPDGLLLAIDGGQTATKGLLTRTDGTCLAKGEGGPSDHFHIEGGVEKNRTALHGTIRAVLKRAKVNPGGIVAIGIGHTGAPTGGNQNPVAIEIVQEVLPHLPPERIVVEPDYRANLAGASAGTPGVVLIAGGGAIAYGYRDDGKEAISGGFGYLIGDEGSAFDIGLRAIEAACKASDERGPPTTLESIVVAHFEISTMREIPRVVYQAGFHRERISLLSPAVVAAAQGGDTAAVNILTEAATELAMTAAGVIVQLYSPGEPATVFLTGGVFSAGPLLLDPFRDELTRRWPEASAQMPVLPPIGGGLIFAARAAGLQPDDDWVQQVSSSLRAIRKSSAA